MKNKFGWDINSLDEICEINYGTRVVNNQVSGSDYFVYGGGGATFTIDRFNREDCLVIARFAMSKQCVRFVRGKFFLNDSGLSLSIKKPDILKNDFLNYQMFWLNDTIYNLSKGAAQRNLDVPYFRKLKLAIPPLPTQHQIVSELDALSEIISKKKQQLEELDKLAQSTFYDMFGDPVTNEKGWEVKRLGEVCSKITDGKHGDCVDESDSGCYFISAKDINERKIKTENARQITYSDFIETNNRTCLSVNDVLVVNTGATIGKTAIANHEDVNKRLTFQKSVAIITTDSKMLDFNFLELYIHLNRNEIYKEASGSAQKNWLLSQMRNYKILLPPLKIQIEFAKLIESIESQKSLITQSIAEVQQLFDFTMDKYFN